MQYLLGHRLVFALCVALVLVAYGLLIRAGLHVYVISGNYTVTVPTLLPHTTVYCLPLFFSFAHVNASQPVPAGCSLTLRLCSHFFCLSLVAFRIATCARWCYCPRSSGPFAPFAPLLPSNVYLIAAESRALLVRRQRGNERFRSTDHVPRALSAHRFDLVSTLSEKACVAKGCSALHSLMPSCLLPMVLCSLVLCLLVLCAPSGNEPDR